MERKIDFSDERENGEKSSRSKQNVTQHLRPLFFPIFPSSFWTIAEHPASCFEIIEVLLHQMTNDVISVSRVHELMGQRKYLSPREELNL